VAQVSTGKMSFLLSSHKYQWTEVSRNIQGKLPGSLIQFYPSLDSRRNVCCCRLYGATALI